MAAEVAPPPAPIRVAISYVSRHWGGVLGVTRALARGLQERGHLVVLICREDSLGGERLRDAAPVHTLPGGIDFEPRSLWKARRIFRKFRPDVLLTMTKKDVRLTAPVARALGIPVVVRHANDQPIRRGPYGRFLYGSIATRHVVNAASTRRTLLDSAPWLAPDRVTVVYNGVDVDAISAAAPADFGLPPGALAVGFLGRLEPIKGIHELAAAWPAIAEALPHAHLLLAGQGSLEPWLRRALGADPHVHFLGFRADPVAVIRALDLLVLPSHREGAPNVVMEAMAAGVPAVATAVSGTPELVRDGATGLLVPPHDPDALVRAVVRLGADPALRRRLGAAAAARAGADFSLPRMIDKYERLLLATVRHRRGRPAAHP